MKNNYEIMYILSAELKDEDYKNEIKKLHDILINNGAKITKIDELGLKDFAYPIKNKNKGYYIVIKVVVESLFAINEFSRLARINMNVLRHLITIDYGDESHKPNPIKYSKKYVSNKEEISK